MNHKLKSNFEKEWDRYEMEIGGIIFRSPHPPRSFWIAECIKTVKQFDCLPKALGSTELTKAKFIENCETGYLNDIEKKFCLLLIENKRILQRDLLTKVRKEKICSKTQFYRTISSLINRKYIKKEKGYSRKEQYISLVKTF